MVLKHYWKMKIDCKAIVIPIQTATGKASFYSVRNFPLNKSIVIATNFSNLCSSLKFKSCL